MKIITLIFFIQIITNLIINSKLFVPSFCLPFMLHRSVFSNMMRIWPNNADGTGSGSTTLSEEIIIIGYPNILIGDPNTLIDDDFFLSYI